MAAENAETSLATAYEELRRREYELITGLLETLPKVDGVDGERIEQVRDALFHADHPFLVVFMGPFSSGKSSIINALLGNNALLDVGVTPTTDRISILRWGADADQMGSAGEARTVFFPSELLKKVSFVDTPGLESVFQQHEEITRKFLHRSDLVLLVMLATQAMTARNVEALQKLKEYGKKVIILINQADLLSDEEGEKVRQYVLEQSKARLGLAPEVWLVSAQRGLDARKNVVLDRALWSASGLDKIEAYIDDQLGDAARLRQKLQTPLQITQHVTQTALGAVRANQSKLDAYRKIADNVEQQLSVDKRELDKIVREVNTEAEARFAEAGRRGGEAIRDALHLSRAPLAVVRGLLSLIGLARLMRAVRGGSDIRLAFERLQAFEPIAELPAVSARLGPRLEGKDIQDVEDLVKYANREVAALPSALQEKVIGDIKAPVRYEREQLQTIRGDLEALEDEARQLEVEKIERAFQSTLIYAAVWEALLILFGIALIAFSSIEVVAFLALIVLGMAGLVFLPLRGRVLASAYKNRLAKLQLRYIEAQTKAADQQIEYGMKLRRDAVAPLTRLITAQVELQDEQMAVLQAAEHEMVAIEAALSALGKKRFLGLRG